MNEKIPLPPGLVEMDLSIAEAEELKSRMDRSATCENVSAHACGSCLKLDRVRGLLKSWWKEIEEGPADPAWSAIGIAEQLQAAIDES